MIVFFILMFFTWKDGLYIAKLKPTAMYCKVVQCYASQADCFCCIGAFTFVPGMSFMAYDVSIVSLAIR